MDKGGAYRPQTQATRTAYRELLGIIKSKLGDFSSDVIEGAAEEVLSTLKNEKLKVKHSSTQIAEMPLAGPVRAEYYFLIPIQACLEF